ncbi:MAG: 50S ribosomal protein L17 [Candidatus Margulisbacteria bacterium]|nr:50S ribosomal protein L17 [Candidatus Margulisiibacteriota bacterium]
MRHRKSNDKIGLPTDQRMALIKNGAKALFTFKQIKTTARRAEEISKYVDRIITKAKKNDLNARREVFKMLADRKMVTLIFKDIISKYQDKNGGYTRILKYGIRRGDASSVSVLELV